MPVTGGSAGVGMSRGNYSVKPYTLTKSLRLVPGIIHSQTNTAKSFDATEGLYTNTKVWDCFASFIHSCMQAQTHAHVYFRDIYPCVTKSFI